MRTTLCALLAATLASVLGAGCDRTHPPARAIEQASAPAAAAPAPAPQEEAEQTDRALALAETHGTGPIDAALTTLQASALKNPRKADLWVMLGRTWVRKARESSDPGYYAHADACARIALAVEPDNRLAIDLQAMVLLNDHK